MYLHTPPTRIFLTGGWYIGTSYAFDKYEVYTYTLVRTAVVFYYNYVDQFAVDQYDIVLPFMRIIWCTVCRMVMNRDRPCKTILLTLVVSSMGVTEV